MKSEPPEADELRIKAGKFDKMMRRALSAPPPEPAAKPKKRKRPVKK